LFVHFALRERASHFEQAVGKRGLAMVDVRDDAEIPYEFWIHLFRLPAGAASLQDDTPTQRKNRAV
jgi:hypothetical protein